MVNFSFQLLYFALEFPFDSFKSFLPLIDIFYLMRYCQHTSFTLSMVFFSSLKIFIMATMKYMSVKSDICPFSKQFLLPAFFSM